MELGISGKICQAGRQTHHAEDIGEYIMLFYSEMADYVIGQSLTIDGGMGNSIF